MSTMIAEPAGTQPPPDNPWYYGWRDVFHTLPDGTRKHEYLPLTLEDALHPQEGDHIVESSLHDFSRDYLADVFRFCVAHDPEALVLSNTGIYWDDPTLDHHVPDDCVIFGVKKKKIDRPSFQVADEGVIPHAIVEIVSPNTRENDVETKMIEYHQAKVPYYFIFDKEKLEDPWKLRGYYWTPLKYLPLSPDPDGRLWFAALGIWLGTDGPNIVCYNGKTNERIGTYTEHAQRLEKVESDLRESATRETTEKQRAEAEKQRAEAEKQRANQEQKAREAAEARTKELEAELARLRGK